MSYRFMRMLVFFDLPTESEADRRVYRRFRKLLITNGFLMLQESVYCKLLLNPTAQTAMTELLRKHRPPEGTVQILTVTEKQFAKMEYLTGSRHSDVIDTDERLVEL